MIYYCRSSTAGPSGKLSLPLHVPVTEADVEALIALAAGAGITKAEYALAMLDCMQGRKAGVWWTRGQIMAGTRRSEKAVNWALLYQRSQGHIECVPDGARNPQYLRYRAVHQQGAK